jgi:hypothetical protein
VRCLIAVVTGRGSMRPAQGEMSDGLFVGSLASFLPFFPDLGMSKELLRSAKGGPILVQRGRVIPAGVRR